MAESLEEQVAKLAAQLQDVQSEVDELRQVAQAADHKLLQAETALQLALSTNQTVVPDEDETRPDYGPSADPSAEDIYTDWIWCPTAETAVPPECSEVLDDESESLVNRIHPHCEFRLRHTWEVFWKDGCLWEYFAWITYRNGRVIQVDTGSSGKADSDECRKLIVCAVDCEEGSEGS